METDQVRLAIIDTQPLAREGLANACRDSGFIDVLYVGDRLAALRELDHRPNVVMLDCNLEGRQVTAAKSLKEILGIGCSVLLLGGEESPTFARSLSVVGIHGFLARQDPTDQVLMAIRSAANGDRWDSPHMAHVLATVLQKPKFSAKELEALKLYATGMKLATVARRMDVKPATIKEYIDRIRRKYNAVGRPAPTKVDLHNNAQQDGLLD